MMATRWFAFWLIATVGCATAPLHPRLGAPPAAATLQAALQARQAAVRGASYETKTTSWLGKDRLRAEVDMLIDRAGRLRFEARISLQGTVATLTTDGKVFSLADLQASQFREGPACPDSVASLIRIPLPPHEVAAILLGDAPATEQAEAVDVGWDSTEGADVLHIQRAAGGPGTRNLWVHMRAASGSDRYSVVALEGDATDTLAHWRVLYDDLKPVNGWPFPHLIRFAEPGRSFDDGVEIKIKEGLDLNPAFGANVFVQRPPPGFAVQEIPCCHGCVVNFR